jgi:ribonucleoside-triphosphate reductase
MGPVQTMIKIIKRNGKHEDFDSQKIRAAILKAGEATGEFGQDVAQNLMIRVVNIIHQLYAQQTPSVENVQDIVEEVLLTSPYKKTAKASRSVR